MNHIINTSKFDVLRYMYLSHNLDMNKKLSENDVAFSLSTTMQPYFREISLKQLIDISNSKRTNSTYHSYRFDFYLPSHRLIIEFDGQQHFRSYQHFGGQKEYRRQLKRDSIKEKFLEKNNISLIRLPYYTKIMHFDIAMRMFFKHGVGKYTFKNDKIIIQQYQRLEIYKRKSL